jgi:short-subunit dehydrogenase
MNCAGKVVVVTGAGSGMGRELVFELLRRKARVAAVDRNDAALEQTAELARAPQGALASFTLSVADRDAVDAGAVATNIAANSGVVVSVSAEGRRFTMLSADRAARDILDGMERNRSRVVVGRDARFLDLLYRLDPLRASAFVAKQMKDLLPPLMADARRSRSG